MLFSGRGLIYQEDCSKLLLQLNRAKSKREISKRGIPKESIIVSILFVLYLNDTQRYIAVQNCLLTYYADDENIRIMNPDMKILINDADVIFNSLSEWISKKRPILN